MNAQTQQPENTYQRKVGFFGSVKQLGVTTVGGANQVTQSLVNSTVNTTAVLETTTGIVNEAVTLWGNDLIQDLQADAEINAIHREIEAVQQNHELTSLRTKLAEAKKPRTTRATKSTQKAK